MIFNVDFIIGHEITLFCVDLWENKFFEKSLDVHRFRELREQDLS